MMTAEDREGRSGSGRDVRSAGQPGTASCSSRERPLRLLLSLVSGWGPATEATLRPVRVPSPVPHEQSGSQRVTWQKRLE